MAEKLVLKALGLSKYSDSASERPEGSLAAGSNIVIDKPGIFSPRRGFLKYDDCTITGDVTFDQPINMLVYDDTLLVYANKSGSKHLYYYDSVAGYFVRYTDADSNDKVITVDRLRTAESNSNLYIAGDTGVLKLDSSTSNIVEAGMPQGLGGSGSTTGSSGFMADNSSVGYRVLWGYRDTNNNLIYGAPSQRIIVTNSAGGARDVSLSFDVPGEITTSHFYQVYRTAVASGATTDPGDDMGLVYEATYSSGTSITITDQTDDTLRGVDLYINATQETISQANDQAPKCTDITLFNGYMFFSNLTYKQSYTFTLLSAAGLVAGTSTITIAGQQYNCEAAEDTTANPPEFKKYTAGSLATNIRQTCESLIKCINQNTNNTTVYAYYDSLYGELPGKIRIEERDLGGSAFTVQSANAGSLFNPVITTAQSSTAESVPHGLAFSKYQKPEAVPAVHRFEIGSRAHPIQKIKALRDSLFIFKDDGIFRLTGTSSSNFTVDLFDNSTKVIAPNTICVLNNMIYGLFDQGVCRISESGVSIISRDIEGDIKDWMGASLSNLESLAYAVPYETDRKYLLAVPTDADHTYPAIFYVYNTLTDSWTTYDIGTWSAIVNPVDDKLYLAKGGEAYVSQERKSYSLADYADEQISVTCTAVSTTTLTLSSVAGIAANDIYFEKDSKFAEITAVDTANNQITVDIDLDFYPNTSIEFTADAGTQLYTSASTYATGTKVQTTTTGTLPAELSLSTDYYVIKVSSTTFKLATSESNAEAGTAITILDAGSGTHSFNAGYAEVRKAFSTNIEWNPITFKSPAHMKQFIEAAVITNKSFQEATISFKTDIEPAWSSVTLTGQSVGLWGIFDWGSVPWGGEVERIVNTRTYVPKTKCRGNTLAVKIATSTVFSDWEISGIEITYRSSGHRSGR